MRLSLLVFFAALAAIAFAVAPGGSEGAGTGRVGVVLDDGSLKPDVAKVRAGRVTFDTVNEGRAEHELLVVRTDLAPGDFPMGLEGPAVKLAGDVVLGVPHTHSANGHDARRAALRHVKPGRSRRETIVMKPGKYVLLCSLPGHYESGQRAALSVVR
jgi:uncharacterized cupredoxin-like copper-binding protein